jgi:hypothetical protein
MKQLAYFLILTLSLNTYSGFSQDHKKDKEILQNIFEKLEPEKHKTTPELIVACGKMLLGTPYIAHTLETSPEQLIVNLRELDCTTFAENCLAIARTVKSGNTYFENFKNELKNIRYRNGKIDGYLSRIHYYSDWIYEKDKDGIIKSVSEEIAQTSYPAKVDFMSTHPASYAQLKEKPELVPVIAKKEKEISARAMFYIPKDKIDNLADKINEGDLVGITTSINGLAISHVGVIVKKNNRVHFMHASSIQKKVVITENTLSEYLNESTKATGIMLSRPL